MYSMTTSAASSRRTVYSSGVEMFLSWEIIPASGAVTLHELDELQRFP
jgi:hypothetical protein